MIVGQKWKWSKELCEFSYCAYLSRKIYLLPDGVGQRNPQLKLFKYMFCFVEALDLLKTSENFFKKISWTNAAVLMIVTMHSFLIGSSQIYVVFQMMVEV